MSLLEDVFLQDEANEAQELERIIEGDEFDERPRSRSDSDNNSAREDEAEEEKKKVDPSSTKTSKAIRNPRFILNPARLTGPRGIQVIPEHFKDFKFKGKGHEKEDLDLVLKKLEHWAYRLYPKFKFEDCLKKIETLGKKRPVMVHLHKIRNDQYLSEVTVVQQDSSDDEAPNNEPPPEDEFDKLLQQQIKLARSTPAPESAKKIIDSAVKENRILIMPKATSSPSISDEQRKRILKSRKLAEERRLERLKNASNAISASQNSTENITDTPPSTADNHNTPDVHKNALNVDETHKSGNAENYSIDIEDKEVVKKVNRKNIIDSSDEDDVVIMNESIAADVHTNFDKDNQKNNNETQNFEKVDYNKTSDDDEIIDMACGNNDDKSSNDKGSNDLENENKANDHEKTSDAEVETSGKSIESNVKLQQIIEDVHKNNIHQENEESIPGEVPVTSSSEKDENNVDDLMDVDFNDDF